MDKVQMAVRHSLTAREAAKPLSPIVAPSFQLEWRRFQDFSFLPTQFMNGLRFLQKRTNGCRVSGAGCRLEGRGWMRCGCDRARR